MKSKILYIERKGTDTPEDARIGRMSIASFSRVITYQGKQYQPHIDRQAHANYYEVGTGNWYWISHCQKDGMDSLLPRTVNIDDDVRQEYWNTIRRQPDQLSQKQYRSPGKQHQ
ncbi:MAG TPA: hypothetical protein PLX97_10975 [Gemmatales bacterium]|nr:hypothetical protein [Gemmatales bacterium]